MTVRACSLAYLSFKYDRKVSSVRLSPGCHPTHRVVLPLPALVILPFTMWSLNECITTIKIASIDTTYCYYIVFRLVLLTVFWRVIPGWRASVTTASLRNRCDLDLRTIVIYSI